MTLPEMMTPDLRRGTAFARQLALKRQEKADGNTLAWNAGEARLR
jgi:hypothetical protein